MVFYKRPICCINRTRSPTSKTNYLWWASACCFCRFWTISNFFLAWCNTVWICSTNLLTVATLIKNSYLFQSHIKLEVVILWALYMKYNVLTFVDALKELLYANFTKIKKIYDCSCSFHVNARNTFSTILFDL